MRVVRKNMLQKIKEELSNSPEDIQRIELSIEDFKDLLRLLDEDCEGVDKWSLRSSSILSPVDIRYCLHTDQNIGDISGSYIVYKGVCIQTHEDY